MMSLCDPSNRTSESATRFLSERTDKNSSIFLHFITLKRNFNLTVAYNSKFFKDNIPLGASI